jgi:hypothetical protein
MNLSSRRPTFSAAVFIVAGLAVMWASLRAAVASPLDLRSDDWEGLSELIRLARGELGDRRVVPTPKLDFRELKPTDAVLVIHPERPLHTDDFSKFIHAGGRLVLLDDFGEGDLFLESFGITRVEAPLHPATFLRQNPAFAIAEPTEAHPASTEVGRVVTNHPTGLRHPNLSPVLTIRGAEGSPDVALAVSGSVGQGRLLAVGDASVVMNSMLRFAGNKAFARALVRYAADANATGQGAGKLFVVSGSFEQEGAYGGEVSPARALARTVSELTQAMRKDAGSSPVLWVASLALGLAILTWVATRAGRRHRPVTPRFVRRLPRIAEGGMAGHAALIAAPKTTRVLAMLELSSALREQLMTALDLPRTTVPIDEVLHRAKQRRGFDEEAQRDLQALLIRMSEVESILTSSPEGHHARQFHDRDVAAMAATMTRLLERLTTTEPS